MNTIFHTMNNMDGALSVLKTSANTRVLSKLTEKKKGEKTIIMEVAIIVVGVAVVLVFKDTALSIVQDMSTKVQQSINNIFGGGTV